MGRQTYRQLYICQEIQPNHGFVWKLQGLRTYLKFVRSECFEWMAKQVYISFLVYLRVQLHAAYRPWKCRGHESQYRHQCQEDKIFIQHEIHSKENKSPTGGYSSNSSMEQRVQHKPCIKLSVRFFPVICLLHPTFHPVGSLLITFLDQKVTPNHINPLFTGIQVHFDRYIKRLDSHLEACFIETVPSWVHSDSYVLVAFEVGQAADAV